MRVSTKELETRTNRMRIAIWALTFGVTVSLISILLLVYGNPSLV